MIARSVVTLMGRVFVVPLLCGLALSGCDHSPDPAETAAATAAAQAAKSKSSSSSVDPMVKAIPSDGRHQAIDLRFELAGRPQVGQPVAIKLQLQAIDDATDVKLTISADPKLAIIAGGDAAFAAMKVGEIVTHSITLRPTGTGIIVVDANLALTANGGPHTLTYAIPIAIPGAVDSSSASSATTSAAHK